MKNNTQQNTAQMLILKKLQKFVIDVTKSLMLQECMLACV